MSNLIVKLVALANLVWDHLNDNHVRKVTHNYGEPKVQAETMRSIIDVGWSTEAAGGLIGVSEGTTKKARERAIQLRKAQFKELESLEEPFEIKLTDQTTVVVPVNVLTDVYRKIYCREDGSFTIEDLKEPVYFAAMAFRRGSMMSFINGVLASQGKEPIIQLPVKIIEGGMANLEGRMRHNALENALKNKGNLSVSSLDKMGFAGELVKMGKSESDLWGGAKDKPGFGFNRGEAQAWHAFWLLDGRYPGARLGKRLFAKEFKVPPVSRAGEICKMRKNGTTVQGLLNYFLKPLQPKKVHMKMSDVKAIAEGHQLLIVRRVAQAIYDKNDSLFNAKVDGTGLLPKEIEAINAVTIEVWPEDEQAITGKPDGSESDGPGDKGHEADVKALEQALATG